MKEIRKKFTYANVMSSLAVFLVLGGATAVAAGHLGKNSVGTAQLKPGAVTGKKIRSQAITGANIKDGTLTASDIAANSITTAQIDTGDPSAEPRPDDSDGEFTMTVPLNTFEPVPVPVPAAFSAFASCGNPLPELSDRAHLEVRSNVDGSTSSDESDAPVQPFHKAFMAPIELPVPHDGHPTTVNTQEGPLITMAPDGTMMAVKDVTVSINVGPDRECVFSGTIRQLS